MLHINYGKFSTETPGVGSKFQFKVNYHARAGGSDSSTTELFTIEYF